MKGPLLTPRSRCRSRSRVFMTYVILFLLSASALFSFTEIRRLQVPDNKPFTLQDKPGIGFDLTASYGAAVIRYQNGTDDVHIFLEAPQEYRELMYHLSLDSSRHLAPPYADGGEWYDDQPRQWRRKVRKFLGFPASRDVGILSRLLGPLREMVEERLGHKVDSAVVTSPDLVALYYEDINDAMEYVGLKRPHLKASGPDSKQPQEAFAADAGYGIGLCSHYKDYDKCDDEEHQMPSRQVLTILYTNSTLIMVKAPRKSALGYYDPPSMVGTYFSLGYDNIHSNPKEEYYWESVKDAVMEVLLRYDGENYPLSQVLMLGECALHPKFLEVVNSTISAIYEETPEYFLSDPIFVAATGAAEFAIRAPWSLPTHWVKSTRLEQAGGGALARVDGRAERPAFRQRTGQQMGRKVEVRPAQGAAVVLAPARGRQGDPAAGVGAAEQRGAGHVDAPPAAGPRGLFAGRAMQAD